MGDENANTHTQFYSVFCFFECTLSVAAVDGDPVLEGDGAGSSHLDFLFGAAVVVVAAADAAAVDVDVGFASTPEKIPPVIRLCIILATPAARPIGPRGFTGGAAVETIAEACSALEPTKEISVLLALSLSLCSFQTFCAFHSSS